MPLQGEVMMGGLQDHHAQDPITVKQKNASQQPLPSLSIPGQNNHKIHKIQGIQEIQNQMVIGLQNNPVDPYIIRKLQP
jgi:hypothetical protein